MRKIFPVLLSIAAVLAFAPANASHASGTAPNIMGGEVVEVKPTEKLHPILEFWKFLQSELAEELQEIYAQVDAELAEALVPTGEPEPDWQTKGIDMVAHLESLPGGIDNNAVLTVGEVPSLQFFGQIPASLLADWDLVQAGPKAVSPAEAQAGGFVVIGPNHIIFAEDDDLKKGNARCMKGPVDKAADYITVYRYSDSSFDRESDASLEAESEAFVIYNMFGHIGMRAICSMFQRDQEGHFRSLSYTTDGRPLKNLDDENDYLKIVSTFDLYQQLNANFTSPFADDELLDSAEEASDPS